MRKAIAIGALVIASAGMVGWHQMPACIEEDGSGQVLCHWDAGQSGNGKGNDAINVRGL